MTDEFTPTIIKIKKVNGIAGQYSYLATVQYPNEAPQTSTFTGSVYGGPIVATFPEGTQTFVTDPERFGPKLDEQWIRGFFS